MTYERAFDIAQTTYLNKQGRRAHYYPAVVREAALAMVDTKTIDEAIDACVAAFNRYQIPDIKMEETPLGA